MAGMDASRKPTADELTRFHEAVAGIEGVELRKMFGFIADGWSLFEPMPGRPMRQYVETPPEVAADVAAVRHWVERAAAYVRTLPPKSPKTPKCG